MLYVAQDFVQVQLYCLYIAGSKTHNYLNIPFWLSLFGCFSFKRSYTYCKLNVKMGKWDTDFISATYLLTNFLLKGRLHTLMSVVNCPKL